MRIPASPPSLGEILETFRKPDVFSRIIKAGAYAPTGPDERYYHWDKLRFRTPPDGLTHQEWWAGMKMARLGARRLLPLADSEGRSFSICLPAPVLRALSDVDRDLSGRAPISNDLTTPGTRDRYLMSALIEEAITSSQLEGASTTRQVASEMLRSGRSPRTPDERMIFNNFRAMQFIRSRVTSPLTTDLILEIHREVMRDALAVDAVGRIRATDDVVVVDAQESGQVLHRPPTWKALPDRMKALCEFANAPEGGEWLHPILRALLLHFWLAYDHPFVDGNGRTARALFYWGMLRYGYPLSEFVSISEVLRKAPAQYARAYLYTESDENDVTYFALYHLKVLRRAVRSLQNYVAEKAQVVQSTQELVRRCGEFNYRQVALLGHALRNPGAAYSVASHATSHMVTKPTARKDLAELVQHGLFRELPSGRAVLYFAVPDLEHLMDRFNKKTPASRG